MLAEWGYLFGAFPEAGAEKAGKGLVPFVKLEESFDANKKMLEESSVIWSILSTFLRDNFSVREELWICDGTGWNNNWKVSLCYYAYRWS